MRLLGVVGDSDQTPNSLGHFEEDAELIPFFYEGDEVADGGDLEAALGLTASARSTRLRMFSASKLSS